MGFIEREALLRIRLHGSQWWHDEWGTPQKIANDALNAAVPEDASLRQQLEGAVSRDHIDAVLDAVVFEHDISDGALDYLRDSLLNSIGGQ